MWESILIVEIMQAYDCINVNHDRINVFYDITNASTRPDELRVSQWNCVDMFTQVSSKASFADTWIQQRVTNMMKWTRSRINAMAREENFIISTLTMNPRGVTGSQPTSGSILRGIIVE